MEEGFALSFMFPLAPGVCLKLLALLSLPGPCLTGGEEAETGEGALRHRGGGRRLRPWEEGGGGATP